MTDLAKSFVVKCGERKVQLAHRSTDDFLQRCKHVFKIQGDSTFRFMRPDENVQVDTDCIGILEKDTDLHLVLDDAIGSTSSERNEESKTENAIGSTSSENNQDTKIENEMCEPWNGETYEVGGRLAINPEHKRSMLLDLIYWRNVRQTTTVLGALFGLLYYITHMYISLPSTIYHATVLFLMVTLGMRAYVVIMFKYRKMTVANPLESLRDIDIILTEETLYDAVKQVAGWLRICWQKLCQVVLIEDFTKMFKTCFAIWFVAYVVSSFNTFTIFANVTLAVFILPKAFEKKERP